MNATDKTDRTEMTTDKITKWYIPVICYFLVIGFVFFWNGTGIFILGHKITEGVPVLPSDLPPFLTLSLIPWGCLLLITAQYLYKRKLKWFKRFAWMTTIASIILVWILEIHYLTLSGLSNYLLYFLWMLLPAILFYYASFFLLYKMNVTDKTGMITYKIIKWFIPVIVYFIFIGLLFLWNDIDILVFGVNKGGGPELPDVLLILFTLPLIPWGYLLLVTAQYLYKRKLKWFKRFAWILIIVSVILAWILEIYYSNYPAISCLPDHLLFVLRVFFPTILFYYVPFFLISSYVFRKKCTKTSVTMKYD
jgi:hypothetical protein